MSAKMDLLVQCGGGQEVQDARNLYTSSGLPFRVLCSVSSVRSLWSQVPACRRIIEEQQNRGFETQIVVFLSEELEKEVRRKIARIAASSFPGCQVCEGIKELAENLKVATG